MLCLQMCQEIQVPVKAQRSRCLLPGWKFYFVAAGESNTVSRRFDPDISGLRFLSPSKREYTSLETVMEMACPIPEASIDERIEEFGKVDLGVTIRRLRYDHDLIGQQYFRVWKDVTGKQNELFGTITECLESLCEGTVLHFKVEYWEDYRTLINDLAKIEDAIPVCDLVDEATARGGHIAFSEKTRRAPNLESPSSYTSFIVPVSQSTVQENRFKILHNGVQLQLQSKVSRIAGAGQGLFVKATCLARAGWNGAPGAFILKPGELLDLGIYAPLRKEDRKPFHVHELKSFIFARKPDIWAFDTTASKHHDALDITDDKTGDLHGQARRAIVVRVNETDGKSEPPSICAEHDPQGSVHYYLGNQQKGLRIPFGKEVELKVR